MSRKTKIRLPDGSERDALEVDFTVKSEEWNEYSLDDDTTVRLRTSAVRVFRLLDDDGEPSFSAEGEPELFVWQNTTAMKPGNVQAALIGADAEQTNGDHEGTLSSPASYDRVARLPAGGMSVRVARPVRAYGGDPDVSERPQGKARNLFVVWLIATLRIVYSSLRHPGHPVVIDRRTGDVWLQHD